MLNIKAFTFNPYQENTYLIYNGHGDTVIIDPGMYGSEEQQVFDTYISANKLTPTQLLNTHCHIDHVLGNKHVYDTYGLKAKFHEGEIPVLMEVQNYAPQMGFRYEAAPIGEEFLSENDRIRIGEDLLSIILAPGHSPAHLCIYSPDQHFLIGGDVLFRNSIGRTDLPGGNHEQLLQSIKNTIYTLPDETIVYAGHGPNTTVGHEKNTNPFIRG